MAAKKKTAAKATSATAARKVKTITEPMNKTQIVNQISDTTGLTKKDVNAVFDELADIIEEYIGQAGS